ncbi:MAG: AAA family ATPase, partial [Schaalia georgiae]|nr:AAA family ATPase [Schaalia georgiae]
NLELAGEGALMSSLNAAHEGRMSDIVATIQAEQDEIIRSPHRGLVVVQGGPGTGKTAVALHRVAYLLYAQRERLERSGVLLVGPSRIFLRYIEAVLPSLGETGVVSRTMGSLVPGVSATAVEDPALARLKGLPAWAGILREAVRRLARLPERDQALRVWNRQVVLRRSDVERARRHAKRSGRPHNVAREGFARELMDVLAVRLAQEAGGADSEGRVGRDDKTEWLAEIRDSVDARRAINLAWMPTSATTLLRRLYARPEALVDANRRAGSPLRPDELRALARPRSRPWTASDVALIDELEELLGPMPDPGAARARQDGAADVARAQAAIESQGLGGGIVTAQMLAESASPQEGWAPLAERAANDRTWAYGHVVVDEAQELTAMEWRALLRRCPSRSFTVVGDLDQGRGARRPGSWEEALGPAARALEKEYVLTVSYRTPRALTELAQAVVARAGSPVMYPMRAVRDVPDCYSVEHIDAAGACDGPSAPRERDPLWGASQRAAQRAASRLDASDGAGAGRIAVIVGARRARTWGADADGDSALEERVSVLSAGAAKGLEFDSVVLVEPCEILADGVGDLFVALTRATHDVRVVHSRPLPAGMEEWA